VRDLLCAWKVLPTPGPLGTLLGKAGREGGVEFARDTDVSPDAIRGRLAALGVTDFRSRSTRNREKKEKQATA
jgi:hypothetical protein